MKEFEVKPIKIAFVGTSCIGKTTLLQELKEYYIQNPNIAFIEETARIFFVNNPSIPDRFSAETQGKIQKLQFENEQKAHEKGARIIICDRSVIDAVVYTKARGDIEGAEKLLKNVRFWLPTYHKFLLLDPTDIPYKTDDIRQETEKTRQNFHNAFIEFFNETEIPYELLNGTRQERFNKISKILQEVI